MHDNDQGFTLVESMVAVLLTLVVISAAIGTFNSSVRVADSTRTVSETNQALQVGMTIMVRDLIQTGQGVPLGGVPLPSGVGSVPVNRPGPANANLTFAAQPVLPALTTGADLGPVILGVSTDMVTVLYADRSLALAAFPLIDIDANGDTMTVDNRTNIGGADGLRIGDLVLFSNPLGNALRMVTQNPNGQVVTMVPGDPMAINQNAAAEGTLINLQSAPGVYPPTTATRVLMVSYYIDDVTDPALPRLVRQVNTGPRLAMALGVENVQVTYDLVDGVNNPTNVDTPPVANSPNQIRKVNLFLAARSLDKMPTLDQFFRNSVATQVGLRSLSFMDRYQ
jgi:prepilin-type N-terminal cleavage/methylation domain-containing protein